MGTIPRLLIVATTLVCGTVLTLAPMLFATSGAHPDHAAYAQLAGFILLGSGALMGFQALRSGERD